VFDTVPYPRGFWVPDFGRFTGDDSKTTYEHVGQFLAQVNDFSITCVHQVRLFPLSLSGIAFNWFISLPPNSIDTWNRLEQRFHDYFYNCESMITSNEIMVDYMRRFRDTHNKCYGLTIGDKDLAELDFARMSAALKDKMEGQDFTDVNQVLQRAMGYESRAREHKTYGQFKELVSKDKPWVNCVEGDLAVEEDTEVCIAEWVEKPKEKQLACEFLKPSPRKKGEIHM
jgi:hypothetical protein